VSAERRRLQEPYEELCLVIVVKLCVGHRVSWISLTSVDWLIYSFIIHSFSRLSFSQLIACRLYCWHRTSFVCGVDRMCQRSLWYTMPVPVSLCRGRRHLWQGDRTVSVWMCSWVDRHWLSDRSHILTVSLL